MVACSNDKLMFKAKRIFPKLFTKWFYYFISPSAISEIPVCSISYPKCCICPFFNLNSFVEIYIHKIHPFKMYNSIVFSIFTELCVIKRKTQLWIFNLKAFKRYPIPPTPFHSALTCRQGNRKALTLPSLTLVRSSSHGNLAP